MPFIVFIRQSVRPCSGLGKGQWIIIINERFFQAVPLNPGGGGGGIPGGGAAGGGGGGTGNGAGGSSF